eukprot:TRINITY_DN29166_c0_g1_i1.p1 TRINITY_DN29166_c0_g1~~TRINITY_DN29166_c0_g1_i1.p1  ORF type:complete len:186 (-),score=17.20 TRINITY_DN29166_c0_g1_i1:475-1032(-)
MLDDLIRGVSTTSMETLDQFLTNEVTNHLFEDKHTPFSGLDLAALNLQRARDHGIPGYNHYRAICNLTRAANFDSLKREIAPPVIERLRRTYAHVDDIDLFTGGLSETPLHGGLVGPTLPALLGSSLETCGSATDSGTRGATRSSDLQKLSWMRSEKSALPRLPVTTVTRSHTSKEPCSMFLTHS